MQVQKVDPEFANFINSLNSEEIKELKPEEFKQLSEDKSPDQFKLVLDKIEDWQEIVAIFKDMSTAELVNYFDGLSEAAWR